MKKIAVLDYPSEFLFPPIGYGGIERWLWSIAKQSVHLGLDVVLCGPLWQSEYLPAARTFKQRLSAATVEEFIEFHGRVDYLVGGHEYWNDSNLRDIFSMVSNKTATFQMMPNFKYDGIVFDNAVHYLFCFSIEMMHLYAQQNPTLSFCAGEGLGENPLRHIAEPYLVWTGRLDEDKAPHLAILAAKKLGMRIKIIGKPQYDSNYYKKYAKYFQDPLVEQLGILAGKEKMEVIARASVAVYTCSPDWVEAAGMIFAEYIRSGVPLAALAWRPSTSAEHAVIGGKAGVLAQAYGQENEEDAVEILASAINKCLQLNRDSVRKIGAQYFDPKVILHTMLKTLDESM